MSNFFELNNDEISATYGGARTSTIVSGHDDFIWSNNTDVIEMNGKETFTTSTNSILGWMHDHKATLTSISTMALIFFCHSYFREEVIPLKDLVVNMPECPYAIL